MTRSVPFSAGKKISSLSQYWNEKQKKSLSSCSSTVEQKRPLCKYNNHLQMLLVDNTDLKGFLSLLYVPLKETDEKNMIWETENRKICCRK